MEADIAKLLLTVAAGALALAGGAFTFVNGRLAEAKTPEHRQSIYRVTAQVVALVISISAVGLVLWASLYKTAGVLFLLSYAVQSGLFVTRKGAPGRAEILSFTFLTGVLCAALGFLALATVIDRVVDVQARIIESQGRIIELLKDRRAP